MSLLDDAKAIDRRQSVVCTICEFIESQPPERRTEFDELVTATVTAGGRTAFAVGPTAVLRILQREGFAGVAKGVVDKHRNGRHRR